MATRPAPASTRRKKHCRTRNRRSTTPQPSCRSRRDRVGYTTLTADGAGTVTARGAEPGEVVQAGQMIVRLARQGGRDAVFDVPAHVAARGAGGLGRSQCRLADDPTVIGDRAGQGSSAQADPVTRTFEVKVAFNDPPAGDAARRHRHRQRQTEYRPGDRDPRQRPDPVQSAARRLDRRSEKSHCVAAKHRSCARHDPEAVIVAQWSRHRRHRRNGRRSGAPSGPESVGCSGRTARRCSSIFRSGRSSIVRSSSI